MSAEAIAKALGGRKAGAAWMARCPAHQDREPSLSIADGDNGRVLVHCYAGCEQLRVITELRFRGLWPSAEQPLGRSPGEASSAFHWKYAGLLWREGLIISGTLAANGAKSDATPQATAARTKADPITKFAIFEARTEARAILFAATEFDLHEAVDVLQADAVTSGLVDQIGQDAVQVMISDAFARVR